jgi:intraflagellar transport protein 52
VTFVYPHGCTLQIKPPAVPLLSSGSAAYPHKACIAAVSQDMTAEANRARGMPLQTTTRVCRGRVLVLGSTDLLGDDWIDKEQNAALARCASDPYISCAVLCMFVVERASWQGVLDKSQSCVPQLVHLAGAHWPAVVCRTLFEMMVPGRELALAKGHARAGDVPTKRLVPDIQSLSCQVRGCLEEAEDLPPDITSLFNRDLYSCDLAAIPAAVQLFHRLGVPKKPLTLIEPQFELPLPPLQPAVFPPAVFEPTLPALERFDLDDAFANEYFKVSQLSLAARKQGGRSDVAVVEDYVAKAAHVVGIAGATKMSGQRALLEVFDQLAKWKLQDAGGHAGQWGEYVAEDGIRI